MDHQTLQLLLNPHREIELAVVPRPSWLSTTKNSGVRMVAESHALANEYLSLDLILPGEKARKKRRTVLSVEGAGQSLEAIGILERHETRRTK